MHTALATCFGDEKSTLENCQSNNATNVAAGEAAGETVLFGSDYENKMKNAGRLDGDNTKHFAQKWPETWAHNQTQTIVSKQKGIASGVKTCIWNIKTSYKKKYLRLQDLYLQFKKLDNVDVYITSYFRDDKESNTMWPSDIKKTL